MGRLFFQLAARDRDAASCEWHRLSNSACPRYDRRGSGFPLAKRSTL